MSDVGDSSANGTAQTCRLVPLHCQLLRVHTLFVNGSQDWVVKRLELIFLVLGAFNFPIALLMLGDYKAKLVKDQHWAGHTTPTAFMNFCFLTTKRLNSL
jgi:hypothetical protein